MKIPENLADDMPDEKDLPYLEMLYKFVFAKKSYYDLVMTRQVEPQAQDDRQSEEDAQTTDTTGENREPQAQTDVARTVAGGGLAPLRRPQRGRKKQHWQIPPVTRVRVRQRIRKWDGYLYNIYLFPYVERRLLDFIA